MRRIMSSALVMMFLLSGAFAASAQTQSTITYTIQPGETLDEIAQRFNVATDCLAEQNLLTEPVQLQAGLDLTISIECPLYDGPTLESTPAPSDQGGGEGETYVVKNGDRLNKIASDSETTVECLVRANNIVDPNLIYVGQELFIPADCETYSPADLGGGMRAGGVVRTPTGFLQLELQPDGTYIVEYGDMLDFIALYFNVETGCLARANGLANPGRLTPGMKIRIYPGCAPWDGPPGPEFDPVIAPVG